MYMIICCSFVVSVLSLYFCLVPHSLPILPTSLSAELLYKGKGGIESQTSLFVGIMSRQEHFLQRRSLRDTWLRNIGHNIQYKFLIGNHVCDVHILDRSSEYSCAKVAYSFSKDTLKNTTLYTNSKNPEIAKSELEPCVGFSFVVHHPIIVRSLGVDLDLPKVAGGGHVKVTLTDSMREIEISSVTFDTRSLSSSWTNEGYDLKKLKSPVLLPKGFEGSVRVKMIRTRSVRGSCKRSSNWTHGGLIEVSRLLQLNNHGFTATRQSCVLATFGFTIRDLKALRGRIKGEQRRAERWLVESQDLSENIHDEAVLYGDVLFLDMVDVYRHLPQKLKLFLKWVYESLGSGTHVLKTDDDTLLDLGRIWAEVSLGSHKRWDWWSCLRHDWPVHRSGKAREDVFTRNVYPPFPSGAGYVLAPETVAWLYDRMGELSTAYQGEDTALGIWLEGMGPRPLAEGQCQWACGRRGRSTAAMCNAMQLTVRNMYSLWGRFLLCGRRICDT